MWKNLFKPFAKIGAYVGGAITWTASLIPSLGMGLTKGIVGVISYFDPVGAAAVLAKVGPLTASFGFSLPNVCFGWVGGAIGGVGLGVTAAAALVPAYAGYKLIKWAANRNRETSAEITMPEAPRDPYSRAIAHQQQMQYSLQQESQLLAAIQANQTALANNQTLRNTVQTGGFPGYLPPAITPTMLGRRPGFFSRLFCN